VKIAIYGGSFDPPHVGHEAIINKAFIQLDIDKLVIVPTFLNPFKTNSHLDAKQRLFLLQELYKDSNKISISDFEILKNRAVYSIETIKYLKNKYNTSKIYLIIGTDNLAKLPLWHGYEEIKKFVEVVVATRSGFLNENYGKMQTLNVDINISSTQLRDNLDLDFIPEKIKTIVKQIWQTDKR
jgi:nicotinate-nucleotide adenylyltransferase